MNSTPKALSEQLAALGAPSDLWQIAQSNNQYLTAIPILVDWLSHVEERLPVDEAPLVREGLVRALTVPKAGPEVADALLEKFMTVYDPDGCGIRWVIGNALSVVADDSRIDELLAIVKNADYGPARQMIVLGLRKSRDSRVPAVVLGLLKDDDVVLHALKALMKLRPPASRASVEELLHHPKAAVRQQARKTLSNLPL
jgi:hypothetical protein